MPKRSRETYLDDTCKRFKEEVYTTEVYTTKRKHEEEPQESRKRQRQVTEEYVSKLESDNVMMREACMGAGATIEALRNKVKQLEMLLNIQRSQMERIRINSDITVY
jgi:ribosomal protein S21